MALLKTILVGVIGGTVDHSIARLRELQPEKTINVSTLILISDLLGRCLFTRELDLDGTDLFRRLLPNDKSNFAHRIQQHLAAIFVFMDSLQIKDHETSHAEASHIPCEQILKKLNELRPILDEQNVLPAMLKDRYCREIRKMLIIFMNPSGVMPHRLPCNVDEKCDQQNLLNFCSTCLELSFKYDCKFASDLTSAMCSILDQDCFSYYSQVLDIISIELLY